MDKLLLDVDRLVIHVLNTVSTSLTKLSRAFG
jgi:hypothetical protein